MSKSSNNSEAFLTVPVLDEGMDIELDNKSEGSWVGGGTVSNSPKSSSLSPMSCSPSKSSASNSTFGSVLITFLCTLGSGGSGGSEGGLGCVEDSW